MNVHSLLTSIIVVSSRTRNSQASRSEYTQLVSTTRLKHLRFRQLPRQNSLESHTKRPPASSNCVTSCSAARTNLHPLYNFWFVLSLPSQSLHRHRHHSAQETRNQHTVGQLSVRRPAALELSSRFAVFVLQAAHTWTLAPTFPISARSVCPASLVGS